jgi:hypothetical protein
VNQLDLDCIDFGTFIAVHGAVFFQQVKGNPYQFLGAASERVGNTTKLMCRFLSINSPEYFTCDVEDLKEAIESGWICEVEPSNVPEEIHLWTMEEI